MSKCSERDLLGLIADLYALSKQNKDFLEARFIKNDEVLARYKSIIKKCIAPSEPWKNNQQISLKDAKKAISDYKKATNDAIGLIDLMVCYVEYGTDFCANLGICTSSITAAYTSDKIWLDAKRYLLHYKASRYKAYKIK
ncbi:MAG: hypothetical protein SFT91_02745 [Rickettsiaceae bacterium]|nr:hypothetical protein [Rickettsiaceae bacterium]